MPPLTHPPISASAGQTPAGSPSVGNTSPLHSRKWHKTDGAAREKRRRFSSNYMKTIYAVWTPMHSNLNYEVGLPAENIATKERKTWPLSAR